MIAAWTHLAITAAVTALVLAIMLTFLRGRPVTSLGTMRGLIDRAETTTPFDRHGYVVLGLVAVGDAVDVYSAIGNPWLAGACLGALAGIAGEMHAGLVFYPLSLIAVITGLHGMFAGSLEHSTIAAALLIPLIAGTLAGMLPPMSELRPKQVLAKCCAAVVLVEFALAPAGVELVEPGIDVTRMITTVAAIVIAAALLALPGGGVAQLLGIGVGMFGMFYGRLVEGSAGAFTVAFVALWIAASAWRSRLIGRRSRRAIAGGRRRSSF